MTSFQMGDAIPRNLAGLWVHTYIDTRSESVADQVSLPVANIYDNNRKSYWKYPIYHSRRGNIDPLRITGLQKPPIGQLNDYPFNLFLPIRHSLIPSWRPSRGFVAIWRLARVTEPTFTREMSHRLTYQYLAKGVFLMIPQTSPMLGRYLMAITPGTTKKYGTTTRNQSEHSSFKILRYSIWHLPNNACYNVLFIISQFETSRLIEISCYPPYFRQIFPGVAPWTTGSIRLCGRLHSNHLFPKMLNRRRTLSLLSYIQSEYIHDKFVYLTHIEKFCNIDLEGGVNFMFTYFSTTLKQ